MKRRFRVVSGARDLCTLCEERGDAVFVDSYSPKKYRAYICYDCVADIVEAKQCKETVPLQELEIKPEEKKVANGGKTGKTNKMPKVL